MAHLSLSLLGPPHLTLNEQPITHFRYDKVQALLIYLAVEADRAHRRDALAGLLWPDLPERDARVNLRQALLTLRKAIGDHTADPSFLLITRPTLQFNRASDQWLDVTHFTSLLAACESHVHRHPQSCPVCAKQRERALALYRDTFLAGFFLPDSAPFEEWALLKREWLQRLAWEALSHLVAYHERRGAYLEAARYARRQLELEPWQEEVHRTLMRLLILRGARSAALAHYEQCRHILQEELGVEPDEATATLYEEIRDGEFDSPVAEKRLSIPALRPHNLPPQLTLFVGREREVGELATHLDSVDQRLITLLGPGGVGKMRLALQVATEQLDAYDHGVFLVALESTGSVDQLVTAIGEAIHCPFTAQAPLKEQLLDHLRDKAMLLVLDNFEHLHQAAPLLVDLLVAAPRVKLLVNSRERLNLKGERLFEVKGLDTPPLTPHETTLPDQAKEHFECYSAVQLFLQAARRVARDFAPTEVDLSWIARICHRLEGLPLGIELAASWVRLLSCREIAGEMEQSLDFLTTTLQDVPARHRSLRAVLDHSWSLLSCEEQKLLIALSTFRGGFRRDAATQVSDATLPLLASLLDKSLLRRQPTGRYDLHEVVRQYAHDKLQASGTLTLTLDRHLAYFLDLAEEAEQQLRGTEQALWLNRLEEERGNLRAALAWAEESGKAEALLRLATALYRFWYWHNHLREGGQWLERALSAAGPARSFPALRAKALHAAGVLADEQGDYRQATTHLEESLAIHRTLGDRIGEAHSLNSLGVIAWEQCDYTRAEALFEESIELRREVGQRASLPGPLNNLGLVALARGEYARAEDLFKDSLTLLREAEAEVGAAMALYNLGVAKLEQAATDDARRHFTESLLLHQKLGEQDGLAYCLEGLAGVALAAAPRQEEAARRAARLLGAAAALRESIHAPLSPHERPRHKRWLRAARDALADTAFTAAWAEGQALSMEELITCALLPISSFA
ncbi:MAG: tetratricopeptide repeat protein [Chloroflexota bacterium]|nr:tetratricopeptide repeat protein [Chloroflexota bacterium]